jgi:hypothetical protein
VNHRRGSWNPLRHFWGMRTSGSDRDLPTAAAPRNPSFGTVDSSGPQGVSASYLLLTARQCRHRLIERGTNRGMSQLGKDRSLLKLVAWRRCDVSTLNRNQLATPQIVRLAVACLT